MRDRSRRPRIPRIYIIIILALLSWLVVIALGFAIWWLVGA